MKLRPRDPKTQSANEVDPLRRPTRSQSRVVGLNRAAYHGIAKSEVVRLSQGNGNVCSRVKTPRSQGSRNCKICAQSKRKSVFDPAIALSVLTWRL